MSRTARLLELLITLRTKSRFTVAELADEFGISRRTMLRDLHALSEMGVPLAASPGPHGGYTLIRDHRLLPLSLAPEEAIGIVLSYEAFLQYAESPFSGQSLSAVTKLRNALPPDVVRDLDRLREHVVVAETPRSTRSPLLSEVLQAALDGVHLDIIYDSSSGVTSRRIFPHGLFAARGLWYCVCHDSRREATLELRVDRIQRASRVDGVERPTPISVREWLETYRDGATDLLPLRARVTRRGARHLELETMFGALTVGAHGEAMIKSQIPASEIDFYAARLLMLGPELCVESPPALIEAMRTRAEGVIALYQ
jgi:predicted DNA-binding transcriptional regulator YafY